MHKDDAGLDPVTLFGLSTPVLRTQVVSLFCFVFVEKELSKILNLEPRHCCVSDKEYFKRKLLTSYSRSGTSGWRLVRMGASVGYTFGHTHPCVHVHPYPGGGKGF